MIVYIDADNYGRKYVREIVHVSDMGRIAQLYDKDYLDHCIETSDIVEQNMLYDPETMLFYPWTPFERATIPPKDATEILINAIIQ